MDQLAGGQGLYDVDKEENDGDEGVVVPEALDGKLQNENDELGKWRQEVADGLGRKLDNKPDPANPNKHQGRDKSRT